MVYRSVYCPGRKDSGAFESINKLEVYLYIKVKDGYLFADTIFLNL